MRPASTTRPHQSLRGCYPAGVAGLISVLGLVNVAVRGWDWFGIVQIPGFASDDRALRRSINGWHELAANALLCLAVIHAVAALYHQLVRGDGLLKRMWFARRNMS